MSVNPIAKSLFWVFFKAQDLLLLKTIDFMTKKRHNNINFF